MKSSTRFYLDGKDEPKMIFACINAGGKRIKHFTGYRIDSSKFNVKEQKINKNARGLFGKEVVKYDIINDKLREIATEINRLMTPRTSIPSKEEVSSVINKVLCKIEKQTTYESVLFWEMYDSYLIKHKNKNTKKQHTASRNHLRAFESYKNIKFSFENITPFLLDEWKRWLLVDAYKDPKKITRTARGNNTIACTFKNVRAFFKWSICEIKKSNKTSESKRAVPTNPFENIEMPKEIYSDPIYLSKGERDKLYQYRGSARENLVRDLFIFQCLTGCRVGDLLRLEKDNIQDGYLHYIPLKTIGKKTDPLDVPLSELALEIISHYPQEPGLFPFITDVNYNRLLKVVAQKAGLDRIITRLNPRTLQEEHLPIYQVISSHMARKTFIGTLYGEVKDAVICSFTGHVEGSKAFFRYRKVSEEMKKDAIKNLI